MHFIINAVYNKNTLKNIKKLIFERRIRVKVIVA